jgi:hypothetical protein
VIDEWSRFSLEIWDSGVSNVNHEKYLEGKSLKRRVRFSGLRLFGSLEDSGL